MHFQKFIDTVKENHWQLFGIEVYFDGQVVHNCHREPIRRYPIYSATKTITSLAVGIAADEGRFSLMLQSMSTSKARFRHMPRQSRLRI